jgi:response regulator RpfG family c-di-GMP phosphodiesterase
LAVLAAGGYLDTVRTHIATLDQNNVQRLAWENATDWERTSPTLNALAQMLGLTDTEVDDLFVAASQVSA